MDDFKEALKVIPELYFLIAKFLSGGPLKETAKTLLKELKSVEVLPRRLDWEGQEHSQSYEQLASQYADVSWDRLASVCHRALKLAREQSPARPLPPRDSDDPPEDTTDDVTNARDVVNEKVTARLSLLSETLVRPKPKYASFKEDHSLVRRLVRRELGTQGPLYGTSCAGHGVAGAGAAAVFPPRLLAALGLQRRTLGHLSAVYCLAFHCSGRYVITGADDLLVKVWSAEDGRLLATLRGAGAEITDVCVSADGALLAAGSVERLVRVWCLQSGAPLGVLAGHTGTITAVRWSAGARWLASTSTDGSVAFWPHGAAPPQRFLERTRPGPAHMLCAAWSAAGLLLAAGSADHHLRIYMMDSSSGPRRVLESSVHGDAVDSVSWAHRGLRLVSGSKDGTAALWTLHAAHWRPRLLKPRARPHDDQKRLKVTMVCWDRSDAYIMTAVSDNTIRVWCSVTCASVVTLVGHSGAAYVLEAHPRLPRLLLSAGHDGQLLVWSLPNPRPLAVYKNHPAQGDGAIFDAKWGSDWSVAASDSGGHLLLLGLGSGHPRLQQLPEELFFHTDYRPLDSCLRNTDCQVLGNIVTTDKTWRVPDGDIVVRDALGGAVDEQSELPPHLMPPPYLVDVEGAPHPPHLQRLVPGRQHEDIEFPAGVESATARAVAGVRPGDVGGSVAAPDPPTLLPPTDPNTLAALHRTNSEMLSLEMWWWRREMRRRPLMINTLAAGGRRRGARAPRAPRSAPPPPPEPPEPATDDDTSDESVRLSDHTDSLSSSGSSSYSDWEEGPPARARRRPVPARRYSPQSAAPRRAAPRATSAEVGDVVDGGGGGEPGELYRVGDWLTAVTPRKAPYHPQVGDRCLYYRLGHQRYFEAVAEKDLYKVNPRDKPWERTAVYPCELVTVTGVRYVIKPPRVVCLRLSALGRRSFTVRYHDMADVIDFLVLQQQFDTAVARNWGPGDRFRCMIDDSWWTGEVLEKAAAPSTCPGDDATPEAFSAAAAPHFLSLKVRWDNGEVERLSPWDLEPLDPARAPAAAGGPLPVLAGELARALYRPRARDWPNGDRAAACRAIADHVTQVMSLSVAEPFVAPVDLARYPQYARVVPYPVDLAMVRARCRNLFYRRAAAVAFDVRYLASNAEQFNEPHSAIVRQARLVTDLLLHCISHWQDVDVLAQYRRLAASYQSSDDEPLAHTLADKSLTTGGGGWRTWCARVLRELLASADSEPFRAPVSVEDFPDYTRVVSSPMDLGRVAARLRAGQYRGPGHFAGDVRLVFSNSRLYNTNRRSPIYSMTVRLSSLFEALWSRGPPSPPPPRRRTRHTRGTTRTEYMNGFGKDAISPGGDSDSSDSEPLAAASRRRHAAHHKGKGVGKKSKSSQQSTEPTASTSGTNVGSSRAPSGWPSSGPESLGGSSPSNHPHQFGRRKRDRSTDGGWRTPPPRTKRARHARNRSRAVSSSSSPSSSSAVSSSSPRRRYSSDRSYKPRLSSDDEPLHLYRQRQEGTSEDGRRRWHKQASSSGGVSLRARGTPRRYNEQSDSDSAIVIPQRASHARHRQPQPSSSARSDHDYLRPHSGPHAHQHTPREQHNGEPPLSISSRGRVRKLTAKARGLLRD